MSRGSMEVSLVYKNKKVYYLFLGIITMYGGLLYVLCRKTFIRNDLKGKVSSTHPA